MAGFPSYTRCRSFRVACFLLLISVASLQLFIAMQEQIEFSSTSSSAAVLDYLHSPYLLTWHAKRLHLIEGKIEESEGLFKRALVNNPLFLPAWLGLAELSNDRGRKDEGLAILDYVDHLSSDISRWRWDKALLAYQLGRLDILAGDLSYVIEKMPEKRESALKMAFSIWDDSQEILARVGAQNLFHLFNYACRTRKIETALQFWPFIKELGVDTNKKDVLLFLETLIQNGEIAKAAPIWKKYFNSRSLLHDGSFEEEPLNTAFGWRVSKPKGSTWRIESVTGKEKSRSMRLHFSGTENLTFNNLSQIVPIDPARKYSLNGWLKTAKLTTDQRPYLEVVGVNCKIPPAKTEIMAESQDWSPFSLVFYVAEDCEAVQVRVRRDRSNHLDNLLAGDLWLRDLEIEATGEIFSSLDTVFLLHDLQIHSSQETKP